MPSVNRIHQKVFAASNEKVALQLIPWPSTAMKGTQVAVQGEARHQATVGFDGKYRISDLPPGKYTVSVNVKSAVWPASSQSVEVIDKGCAEVNFNVDPFRTQDGASIHPRQ